jgi:cullin 1
MIIFKYLEEKDVFQTFYSTKLSKRLIHGVSVSDEAEESMISKLKEACGFEYTNKLRRMFTGILSPPSCAGRSLIDIADVNLSKELTDSFKEHMEQNHYDVDINFSVMVLGTNFWPLNPLEDGFIVPTDIQVTYDRFQKYYQTKHPKQKRKLTWLWNYSKSELQTNYLNQKYILMTSACQTAVLLQYNNNDTLSLDELATATNVGKDLLTQVLQPLVKSRILISEETDQYDLNLSMLHLHSTCSRLPGIPRLQIKEDSREPESTNQGGGHGRVE